MESILVIIPVRNEESTITGVIKSLQSYGLKKIRVVDNGSTDNSVEKAKTAGAEVILEPTPGYGRACWRGLQQLPPEIDWILFCDGDGSDQLSQLPQFVAKRDNFDLILGNRRASAAGRAAMTPVQNFGNWLATFLISWGWGYRYCDLGPLRLIRRYCLEQIQMHDRGFGWTVEMQARAIECELRICEIPVGYRCRQGGRSKISGTLSGSIKAGTVILTTIFSLYLRRLRQGETPRGGDGETPRGGDNSIVANQLSQSQFQHPKSKLESLLLWLGAGLLLVGAASIIPYGDFRQVESVPKFWLGIGVMSLGFILSWRLRKVSGVWFWGVAILTRLLLLPMYPGDDVWRYLWEGYIQTLGFSPYELAPNAAELIPYRTQWWSQINYQGVSAIYPPVAQLGFRALATITPSVWLFKAAFILADLLTCWLLSRRFTYQQAIFYAWNPLIIYSFAGGAHYDSWFILPLVAAWLVFDYSGKTVRWLRASGNQKSDLVVRERESRFAPERGRGGDAVKGREPESQRGRWGEQLGMKSALLLGISIAVKWISLPILGFLTWRAFLGVRQSFNQRNDLVVRERESRFAPERGRGGDAVKGREPEGERKLSVRRQLGVNIKRAIVILLLGFLPLGISAIGFCHSGECPLIPTGSVFVSHGRSAELIPYLVSLYWEPSRWVNWIYLFPLGLAGIWLLWRARSFLQFAEWYFFALVTLSPIIHAWYFTWLVPFGVATGNLGVRLVSISVFVYFVLQHRAALGNYEWYLTRQERLWIWLPFVLGWLWTTWSKSKSKF